MKYLFILLLTLILPEQVSAKKFTYPLEHVIGMADLIVVGEISDVHPNRYDFSVSQTIKGQSEENISVQMFKEWTCDVRMKPAEEGQKLVLFLIKKVGHYEIINRSTGEMFIENGTVMHYMNGDNPALNDLTSTLKAFTGAYKLKNKEYSHTSDNIFLQLISDEELIELSNKSPLTTWLFSNMENAKIEKN